MNAGSTRFVRAGHRASSVSIAFDLDADFADAHDQHRRRFHTGRSDGLLVQTALSRDEIRERLDADDDLAGQDVHLTAWQHPRRQPRFIPAARSISPRSLDPIESGELDAKTLALVRLAALAAVGGAVPTFGARADAAVSAGATAVEIVDVLVGVVPVLGLPLVVAAAPKLALALGYDTDDVFEPEPGR